MARSAAAVESGIALRSNVTASGSHWWWKRGASTACRASIPKSRPPNTISITVLMIVRPPGEPVTMNSLPFFVTIVGVIELSIRLPGAMTFAGVPMSPVDVRFARLLVEVAHLVVEDETRRRSTTTCEPNPPSSVKVFDTAFPSWSTIENCVVSSCSSDATWVTMSLPELHAARGVRPGSIDCASVLAYVFDVSLAMRHLHEIRIAEEARAIEIAAPHRFDLECSACGRHRRRASADRTARGC